jgi:hypothetical protein
MTKRNGDLTTGELEKLLVEAETKLQRTHNVLGTLISWMAQSANSPIRRDEARRLLELLQ